MRLGLIICLIVSLSSCGSKDAFNEAETPENLITRAKLVNLLLDVQLLEGAKAKNYISKQDSMIEIKENYAAIFKKHGVTKKDFEQNLLYYYDFTGQMEEIYGEVLSELMKMEAELKSVKEEEEVKE